MEDMLRVGVYVNTHGVRGEIKVFPTTDDVKRFRKGVRLFLAVKPEPMPVEIESVKYFKNLVILKFRGIDNINEIEKYKGTDLMVLRSEAIPLAEGEHYVCDLLDCRVVEENGTEVGILTDVLQTGANDVYEVTTKEGKQILLPAIPDCIRAIDIENKTITVYLMPGLV